MFSELLLFFPPLSIVSVVSHVLWQTALDRASWWYISRSDRINNKSEGCLLIFFFYLAAILWMLKTTSRDCFSAEIEKGYPVSFHPKHTVMFCSARTFSLSQARVVCLDVRNRPLVLVLIWETAPPWANIWGELWLAPPACHVYVNGHTDWSA